MPNLCCECGSQVPETWKQGYCPKCLLKLAEAHTETVGSPFRSREFPFQLPRAFGKYELLELLGEGGMGVVFKAVQTNLKRPVALKMLRSGLLASHDEQKRFQMEAQAVGRLKHPGIVSVHEIGEYEGRLFFSMDWIAGRSLAEIVGRTPLAPATAARYVMRIAEAVHYAHSQGILHRDLKPANVVVDAEDNPHITDFGLAKELSCEAQMTRSGAVLGTPNYMSPEQAAGQRKRVNTGSDIYSLGAILYDLLTGRPPFQADSSVETLRQVVELNPAAPRLLNANVDRELETICLKCLAKEPAHRYRTAQELADDLRRFLKGEPIHARPPHALIRACRWATRKPAMAGTIAFAAMFVLLLAVAGAWSIEDSRDNIKAAPWIAKGMAFDFSKLGKHITEIGSQPELLPLLTNRTWQGSDTWTDQTNTANPLVDLLLQQTRSNTFEYYLLLNPRGEVLAYYRPAGPNRTNALPLLWKRDYFRGATNLESGKYYVGRVYKAKSDSLFKIAVTTPVRDGQSNLLGVVAGMVGTASTEEPTGLRTSRTKTVLISPMDPSSALTNEELNQTGPDPRLTNEPNYVVFWHPAYSQGQTSVVSVEDPELIHHLQHLSKDPETNGFVQIESYTDPVSSRHPFYSSAWVAGLSHVPGTPLIEVYQSRDRVYAVRMITFVLVCLGVSISFAWFMRRRILDRRESRSQAAVGVPTL